MVVSGSCLARTSSPGFSVWSSWLLQPLLFGLVLLISGERGREGREE